MADYLDGAGGTTAEGVMANREETQGRERWLAHAVEDGGGAISGIVRRERSSGRDRFGRDGQETSCFGRLSCRCGTSRYNRT